MICSNCGQERPHGVALAVCLTPEQMRPIWRELARIAEECIEGSETTFTDRDGQKHTVKIRGLFNAARFVERLAELGRVPEEPKG